MVWLNYHVSICITCPENPCIPFGTVDKIFANLISSASMVIPKHSFVWRDYFWIMPIRTFHQNKSIWKSTAAFEASAQPATRSGVHEMNQLMGIDFKKLALIDANKLVGSIGGLNCVILIWGASHNFCCIRIY